MFNIYEVYSSQHDLVEIQSRFNDSFIALQEEYFGKGNWVDVQFDILDCGMYERAADEHLSLERYHLEAAGFDIPEGVTFMAIAYDEVCSLYAALVKDGYEDVNNVEMQMAGLNAMGRKFFLRTI